MHSRGIPMSFMLLTVFALLAAGIIALAGFALEDKTADRGNAALEGSRAAAAELVEQGRFPSDADVDAYVASRVVVSHEAAAVPAPTPAAPPAAPPAGGTSAAARGQELFFANGCNACHGDQGQGLIGPTIAQTLLTLDQVIAQYRAPRLAMPAFPASLVPDADVADIYAWLQTQPLPDTIIPGEGTPR